MATNMTSYTYHEDKTARRKSKGQQRTTSHSRAPTNQSESGTNNKLVLPKFIEDPSRHKQKSQSMRDKHPTSSSPTLPNSLETQAFYTNLEEGLPLRTDNFTTSVTRRSGEAEIEESDPRITFRRDSCGDLIITVTDNATGVRADFQFGQSKTDGDVRSSNKPEAVKNIAIRQLDSWILLSKTAVAYKGDLREFDVVEIVLPTQEPNRQGELVARTRTPTAVGNHLPVLSRYVLLQPDEDRTSFKALPIRTYLYRGVAAPGVIKSHHSVIHTNSAAPDLTPEEAPVRLSDDTLDGVRYTPIRVVNRDRTRPLDPMSRLNFRDYIHLRTADIYNLFGRVHKDSRAALLYQFRHAQNRDLANSTTHETNQDQSGQQQPPDDSTMQNIRRIANELIQMQERARLVGVSIASPTRQQLQRFAVNRAEYEEYAQQVIMQIEAALRAIS